VVDNINPPRGRAAKPGRDYRLDFFRGIALVFIFIDHIPDNALSNVTLHSFALCDAAEVFIFISGYTAAMVYGRAMLREGGLMASARIWRRVWQLYVAHLCLFMIYNAEVSYTMLHFNNPLFSDELGVGAFLDEPELTFIRVLSLEFQPSLLNILPLYISLLLIFPAVILALRRSIWLALVPSAFLYVAAVIWRFDLPVQPGDGAWFFDPFAWQFLFVIASTFGFRQAGGAPPLPRPRWLLMIALSVAGVGLVLQGSATLHELFGRVPALVNIPLWADDKTVLSPVRIVSMLSLAYLVARLVDPNARFLTSWMGWPLVLCGQKSLYVFCLTILLSVLAIMIRTLVGSSLLVQLGINFAGVLVMIALALLMAWFDNGGRLPPRPHTVVAA
jgi:hypothetical protein